MITAIVYTSHAGHTKAYAGLLSKKTGLPVYEAKAAAKALPRQAEVIFLGWLMAGSLKGYKEAAKRFRVAAVCAVGMSAVEAQRGELIVRNRIPETVPVFCLQGGFEMDKVRGVYGFMMKCMRSSVGKSLAAKADRTPEEEESFDMLMHGRDCVCEENLEQVLDWYENTK